LKDAAAAIYGAQAANGVILVTTKEERQVSLKSAFNKCGVNQATDFHMCSTPWIMHRHSTKLICIIINYRWADIQMMILGKFAGDGSPGSIPDIRIQTGMTKQ
jgi:TonB-dependent SusC/RagA subfamily outer membrane receptor